VSNAKKPVLPILGKAFWQFSLTEIFPRQFSDISLIFTETRDISDISRTLQLVWDLGDLDFWLLPSELCHRLHNRKYIFIKFELL